MDIKLIRDDPEKFRQNQIKRYGDPKLVDDILAQDVNWKRMLYQNELYKKLKNKVSKSFKNAPTEFEMPNIEIIEYINDIIFENKHDICLLTRDQLKNVATQLNQLIKAYDEQQNNCLKHRDELIGQLGNILDPRVKVSNTEDDNILVETVINKCSDTVRPNMLTHIDLTEKLGIIDTVNGIKVAGNRGYFLTGFGVKLNNALLSYAMDFMESKKYELMETPEFINGETINKVCQLSDYEETLYKLEGQDKYLIATSEQPLTGMFSDTNINNKNLPIMLCGKSNCYRKETGRHGANTRGIYRVHQFTKIEQFCVTPAEDSEKMFKKMMDISKEFYDSLGITYRVISIVSGALNDAASIKYDLEAWFPGSNQYCELVSCTNVLDYFSKRINTKNNKNEYLHMLNCTLCANTRVICCLLETYQTENGIIIPEVLRKYFDGSEIINYKN